MEIHRNGSNVLDCRIQRGHVREDLNCAWKTSCIKDSLQRTWLASVSAATCSSGLPKVF